MTRHRFSFRALAASICFSAVGWPCVAEPPVPKPVAIAEELAGLEAALRRGTVLVLGELHGTAEAPAFVGRVAELAIRRGLPVTVALELPRAEESRVAAFLASAGEPADRAALLAGPFWQSSYQDGRASEAMVRLLDDLRRHVAAGSDPRLGRRLRVVCFDLWGARATVREPAMAEKLASAIAEAPQDLTVVLTGNLHASLARGGRISEPMALRVARQLPETRLLTLKLAYSGGTVWICGPAGGCRIKRVGGHDLEAPPHVALHEKLERNGFHGSFYVGEIHASPPAVPPVAAPRPSAPASPFQDPAQTLLDQATPAVVPSVSRPPVPLVGEWPQWMGPRADGAAEPGWLPLGASAALELDWRRPIGRGYSSISISGGRALTLEADKQGVWLVALDVADGRELWRAALKDPSWSEGERVERPSSTPAIGGGRIFTVHPEGLLIAFDAAGGRELWTRDLVRELGASPPSYGMSTSPMLSEGRLFVLAGGREGNNLIELDPASGKILTALGPAGQGSYSTPVLGVLAGKPQLIVPAGDRLYGVEPAGGEPVWSHGGIPFPDRIPLVLSGGRVFVPFQEHAAMFEVSPRTWTVRELWRSEQLANSYSPAVHHRGSLYGLGSGHLMCLDAATGKTRWQQRVDMGGTLIRIDDHLAVFGTMSGRLRLVEANPSGFAETAGLEVFGPGQHGATAPSFGAGRIFVRGEKEIAAVRLVR